MTDDEATMEETNEECGITFKAHFARFATQADGAVRLSLDLSPSEVNAVLRVLSFKDRVFQVAMIPEPKDIGGGPW